MNGNDTQNMLFTFIRYPVMWFACAYQDHLQWKPSTHPKNIMTFCHDPSHGGFYMAEGAFYIRIGLPPHVVSGDCLASSCCGLTGHYLYCHRAYLMSRDWGCTSMCCWSPYAFPFCICGPEGYSLTDCRVCWHGTLYPMTDYSLRCHYCPHLLMLCGIPYASNTYSYCTWIVVL